MYIDLVKLNEEQARERVLAGVQRERAKPANAAFPVTAPRASGKLPTLEHTVFPGSLPPIWNVPYLRNALFIGRNELLTKLATALHTGEPTALSQPQAINGLGGIGKTQITLEYAYRSRHEYQAVLWAQAEAKETLTSSYLALAMLLNLPEKDVQESTQVIVAVKRWLQTTPDYLLILDNTDDLAVARDFLPPSTGGHILLTTRAQDTGSFARRLEVETFSIKQSIEFLLRRAGVLTNDMPIEQAREEDQSVARSICEELGGLPLALDQAGAYIEETGCSLTSYQHLYQQRQSTLLAERRGLVDDHSLPVATTWKLSFEQVEKENPAAADLLRVCAFLAPDAIPESIIVEGASHLSPELATLGIDSYLLDQAINTLRAYSLLQREGNDAFTASISASGPQGPDG